MQFIPNAPIKEEMLKEIGLESIDDLFSDIPKKIMTQHLALPPGISQQATEERMKEIGKTNQPFCALPSFLGGGTKPHYIPAVVKSILQRSEFYTAYTPYQPEASQGFLQAVFEYQSMIAELTGMDISNASLYDGATALGEAALMCSRVNRRKTFVIPKNISWEKKCVLTNYVKGAGIRIQEAPYHNDTGAIDVDTLRTTMSEDCAGVYLENPNYFGVFEEDVEEIQQIIHEKKSLFVVGVDPLSLGIVKSPGEYEADMVIGEGNSLGLPMDFGGSTLGMFACRNEFVRQIPGRLIGMTKDKDGKRAFCMTMQTREQHIRREKATSNICTNEGLCMLAATVYLSWLGGNGLRELSALNYERGQRLEQHISSIKGFEKVFSSPHFNEFVIRCADVRTLQEKLLQQGIQGGLLLDQWYHDLSNCMLFGVTEMHRDSDIKRLLSILQEGL